MDPLHADLSPKYDLFLEKENYMDITLHSKFNFLELYTEFWVDVGGVPLPQQAGFLHLPFATSYLCKTRFSAATDIKPKYQLMSNLKNDLRAAISKLQQWYDNLCSKRQPHPSH
jgi:hypothetical protein